MRLIDADALKEAIENHFDMLDAYFPNKFIEEIDNARTIIWCNQTSDGVPMMDLRGTPKGEWEESHIYSCGKILKGRNDVIEHKCSVCKRWSIKWDGTIPDNFCSHCGADMRGEKDG